MCGYRKAVWVVLWADNLMKSDLGVLKKAVFLPPRNEAVIFLQAVK